MLTPEAVKRTLKGHRKGQDRRPCYHCRQRKVKCDNSRPCKRCIERSHEALCTYEPPGSSRQGNLLGTVPQARVPSLGVAHGYAHLASTKAWETISANGSEDIVASAPDIVLGEHSVPSFVEQQIESSTSLNDDGVEIRQAALPMLGLQSLTQESLPRWKISKEELQNVLGILPPNDDVIELFSRYRHTVYPLNPFLVDLNGFEARLCSQLESFYFHRESLDQLRNDLSWIALLFAVLASGLQSSSRRISHEKLTCRRYISASYHCLNLADRKSVV